MGLLDRFKKKKLTIDQLIADGYQPRNFAACKFIWKNYVPARGQSDVLQGELLREIEKLRYEAQNNGNLNWDDDFSYFCDFLRETLCAQDIFSAIEKEKLSLTLNYLKTGGENARLLLDGSISEADANSNQIVYTDDALYDLVADAIGFLHTKAGAPLPYTFNDQIHH